MRAPLFTCLSAVLGGVAVGASACADPVDCDGLCAQMLACEVTFAAPDDLDGERITRGERSAEASCALGCDAHVLVTEKSAACVDGVSRTSQDPHVCQEPVLACFGLGLPAD